MDKLLFIHSFSLTVNLFSSFKTFIIIKVAITINTITGITNKIRLTLFFITTYSFSLILLLFQTKFEPLTFLAPIILNPAELSVASCTKVN